jgi:hypothetical protein
MMTFVTAPIVLTHSTAYYLFISTRIFYDRLRPQILSVGTTGNAALSDRFGDNRGQNNEKSECLLRTQLFIPTVPV